MGYEVTGIIMRANLADAMTRLLDGSSNEGLSTLSQVLCRGQHTLGQLWTSQLSPQALEDLKAANTVLPGLNAQFEAAQPHAQRQPPAFVDAELLAGTTINFPRSLARLAWILQHAATLLPMAGDIQAVLNSQTAGVSDIHAWGMMQNTLLRDIVRELQPLVRIQILMQDPPTAVVSDSTSELLSPRVVLL